jgi:hypothetical protein
MRATAAAFASAVAVVAAPPAAPVRWHAIAYGNHYALWADIRLVATAQKPQALAVRVVPTPHQDVRVKWSMTCKTGNGPRSRTGRYVTKRTTLQTLRMPVPHPRSCRVSADGRLTGGGILTMRIYSRS